MYLIVTSSQARDETPAHARHFVVDTQRVTEYASEAEFKAAGFRLLAAGTAFQAYSAQRLQLTSSVQITVEE